MDKLIFVTAFKDLKRGEWTEFARTNTEYYNYFNDLFVNVRNMHKIIVFMENENKEELLAAYPEMDGSRSLCFMNINEVDTFMDTYLETDMRIMGSEEYKQLIPKMRRICPEHLYSDYNLINHSKVNFLRYARNEYPEYDFYSWIDFGYMRCERPISEIDIDSLPTDKITYQRLENYMGNPENEYYSIKGMLKTNVIYMAGSSFIVPKGLVYKYEKIYEDKLKEFYEMGVTDDDQNVVLQIFYDNRDLFNAPHHDQFHMFFELIKKQSVVEEEEYPVVETQIML